MTIAEFEKTHPEIARALRRFSGDHISGRHDVETWERQYVRAEVTGVYLAYEEGAEVWYALVEENTETNMAIYQDGKWAWTKEDSGLF